MSESWQHLSLSCFWIALSHGLTLWLLCARPNTDLVPCVLSSQGKDIMPKESNFNKVY